VVVVGGGGGCGVKAGVVAVVVTGTNSTLKLPRTFRFAAMIFFLSTRQSTSSREELDPSGSVILRMISRRERRD